MFKSLLALSASLLISTSLHAETIKVLTAGAFKAVVSDIIPAFEAKTGHKIVLYNDTVGGLTKRIEGGESFDFVIGTPNSLKALGEKSHVVADTIKPIAKVGIGIAIKEGAPKISFATVDDFKAAMVNARKITYIDPAAGGSSGIYTDKLLRQLGIYEAVQGKLLLAKGGYVAEAVAKGEADIAIHQISEILPVKGAVLAAPLPDAIQNYTTYAVGIGVKSDKKDVAKAFLEAVFSDDSAKIITSKGMSAMK